MKPLECYGCYSSGYFYTPLSLLERSSELARNMTQISEFFTALWKFRTETRRVSEAFEGVGGG